VSLARVISDEALVALTIRGEADAEDMATKIAVAEVIRNRMLKHYSSDGTVAGTVCAPGQFSCWWWKDPGLIRMMKMMLDAHFDDAAAAWQSAMTASDTAQGALRYVNLDVAQPTWATSDALLVKIGKLSFYRG
jgi:spore germination cell wall hydrolase CwlJ-like protein